MALTDPHTSGATPLTPEQLLGLKVPFVTTHAQLNEIEQANIVRALVWARRARSIVMPSMLSREFIDILHERMYGNVWTWAGQQRTVDTNIGVSYPTIGVELKKLFDDALYWLARKSFEPIAFAVRVHHRLVKIHVYPNGNGRHARLYADLILTHHFGEPRLSWGGGELGNADPRRDEYIEALRVADQHNHYDALLAFATS